MLKQTVILLLSCWLFVSVFALQPTPAQQFIILPEGGSQFFSNSWHVGDDIINFYKTKDSEGYMRISHKTSQFEDILTDTIASCQKNLTLLDPSYYHPTAGVFLYYCIANNSLLTIGQDYKVQEAIPISTSQKFSEVILGHNEQGLVTILGLYDLLTLPATQPTELILVDLKIKAVENHVIFNKKKMTPKVVDYSSKGMLVALGGLDLLVGLNADTWNIRDAKTNETLYASFRNPKDIMVSESHIGVAGKVENKMYVFDRKNPGQLPKEIEIYPGSHYLDKTTSQVFKLTSTNQYSITDLETLNVHVGNRGPSAAFIIRYANLTDLDNPLLITNPIDMDHVLVNPKTYGFLYWKCPNFHSSRGSLVAGDAANEYFYVWNEFAVSNVINIDSYKALAKVGSYPLTINQTQKYENPIYFNLGNKKLLLSFQENVTIVDLALKTFKTYDAPVTSSWQSNRDVGVFYDKEKTPYVLITQAQSNFGDPAHTPLLLDLASDNLRPIPGFNPLTKSAKVTGNCGYALVDQFKSLIGTVRLFYTCGGDQAMNKITI